MWSTCINKNKVRRGEGAGWGGPGGGEGAKRSNLVVLIQTSLD